MEHITAYFFAQFLSLCSYDPVDKTGANELFSALCNVNLENNPSHFCQTMTLKETNGLLNVCVEMGTVAKELQKLNKNKVI